MNIKSVAKDRRKSVERETERDRERQCVCV